MENFAKYAYLNNYIKKFREILPLNNLTTIQLHDALYHVGFKPDYGTMYSRNKLENILNSGYILNKIRAYLQIMPHVNNSNGYSEIKPIKKQKIIPNYYTDEDMKNASDELLKNDGVFNESKKMKQNTIRINENTLKKIVSESVKKILKESDEFTPQGYKGMNNYGGNEIQINRSGDAARIKFQDGEVTDWLEIDFDEQGVAYVTTPYGEQEKLSDYMRY